jgi:hypothetical protein
MNGYRDVNGELIRVGYRDIAMHVKKFEQWKVHLGFMDQKANNQYKEFLSLITLELTRMLDCDA